MEKHEIQQETRQKDTHTKRTFLIDNPIQYIHSPMEV